MQVPEILPQEVLEKMHAPAKSEDPVITAKELVDCDALIFGFPTRFGMMASQFKVFSPTVVLPFHCSRRRLSSPALLHQHRYKLAHACQASSMHLGTNPPAVVIHKRR